MTACECCWNSASFRAHTEHKCVADVYQTIGIEHQDRGCVCTENTEAGRKARAGQFWDDVRKIDTRDDPKT